jgi:hypothetical protein
VPHANTLAYQADSCRRSSYFRSRRRTRTYRNSVRGQRSSTRSAAVPLGKRSLKCGPRLRFERADGSRLDRNESARHNLDRNGPHGLVCLGSLGSLSAGGNNRTSGQHAGRQYAEHSGSSIIDGSFDSSNVAERQYPSHLNPERDRSPHLNLNRERPQHQLSASLRLINSVDLRRHDGNLG